MSYILRLGQIQKKIEILQSEVDTLEGGGGGSGSGVNAEVQAAINTLQTDLNDLENQYTSLLTQYSNISNTVTTIDGEVNTLQSELNIVETLHTNLNNEVTTIGNELDTLRSSHISLSSTTGTLNTEVNTVQNDLDILEASYVTLQTGYTTLNTTIGTLGTQYTTINNKANAIQADLDTLEVSHITLQSSNTGLISQYNTLNTTVISTQSDLDTLESSHITLQGGYSTLTTQYNTLNTKANSIQSDLDTLEASHVTLQSGYTGLNSSHVTLGTTVTALDTQLDALEIEVDNLITSINSSGVNWSDITPATIPTTFNPVTHASRHIPGGIDIIPDATTTISGLMSNVDKTKLNGVANSATLNSTDTFLLNRANHTGTATTINTNAVERSTSGTLSLGATSNNTTVELGNLSTVINVGTGAVGKTINIGGHSADILNITGSVVSQNVTNTTITDKLITLNKGGAAASADGSGIEIEEAVTITSYFKIGNTRNSYDLKVPARAGIIRFTPSTSAFAHEILATNTAVRTFILPDADINLNSQAQNLIYASPVASTGAMSIRSLVGNDIPLATNTTRGAISREVSGTFIPLVYGSSVAGNNTYGPNIGRYYLTGRSCTVVIYINVDVKDSAMAGNIYISGLPFASIADTYQSLAISQHGGFNLQTGYTQLGLRIENNDTKLIFIRNGSGLAAQVIDASFLGSTFAVMASGSYIIA